MPPRAAALPLLALLALPACGPGSSVGDAGTDASPCHPPAPPEDPLASMREACGFGAGAMPERTVGDLDLAAARAAITHVIVVMQENHSFDHLLGTLGQGHEGFPAGFSNPDADGNAVRVFHLPSACVEDVPHQWEAIHESWNGGAMDGFVRAGGANAMGYYERADHPFYSWLFTTFASSDRYFGSVLSGTWPNRDYLLCGTSNGVKATYGGYPNARTVFDQLDDAGVSWGAYVVQGEPFEGTLGWAPDHPGVYPFADFIAGLGAGTLPRVTFVDAGPGVDEHPPADLNRGEAWVRGIVGSAFTSPLWPHLALVFTYDENGGFFDHVPPPSACLADPSQYEFDHLGVRVPFVMVSPWARAGYVSHRTHSHTSVLRLIQSLYDLPALTGRDANSDALGDLFDFQCPAFERPPTSFPTAGPGGC